MHEGNFIPRRIGYTTAKGRLAWYRDKLAVHRKNKRTWSGTKETYEWEVVRMSNRIRYYRSLLLTPYYASKIREAQNRKRRKTHPRLRTRFTVIEVQSHRGDGTGINEYIAHLPWMVFRVRTKYFRNMKHLAHAFRKTVTWIWDAKREAIKAGLITEEEWGQCFRKPGRPRKGVPRGPYKTKTEKTG